MRSTSTSRSAWTSERRRARASGAVVAALALLGAPVAARAQQDVVGQLHLLERPGETTHDLAQAVVWLEAERRPEPGTLRQAAAPALGAIEMKEREFAPHVRIVRTGGSVEFPNDDPFSHNVFSSAPLGPFDLGLYRTGKSRAATFARPGVYPIYCNIHHRMVSYVIAVPTPWYAQPASDGRFALHDVPAGSYTLHVWHERGGETTRPVTVGAAAPAPVQLSLDARSYTVASHLNKFGQPYTATRADRY